MAGKSKSQLKQDKKEDMKKILINTVTIKVPSIMTKYDRETKKLIKIHTLTKGNNITKRNKKPVIKICLETGKELQIYESLEIAMIENNIKSKGNIVSVCQNKRKKCSHPGCSYQPYCERWIHCSG
jgi:hypothetical protein